ncbi:MAG: UDP-2,4-diacetamido-2,4,6-trideoxy-beta-L-altropyranose hydrolase [Verrucomicrobia bacterium]|nr:UDP-2,4-diacetamido-2,4,6-trideoxy-beta-L-altropyranose hydrolase [Verrucomicrobiota bacterium]
MRLLIRADASVETGTGHVLRCLALAQACRRDGGAVLFACAACPAELAQRLRETEAFDVTLFEAQPGGAADAEKTRALAAGFAADWIVADGYAFDAAWQQGVRADGRRLLLLDDHAHASAYVADLVLHQNGFFAAEIEARRAAETRVLAGPRFALLRDEFLAARRAEDRVFGDVLKVLVTLGGTDPRNATSQVVAALRGIAGIQVVVVVGAANPHRERVAAEVAQAGPAFRVAVAPQDFKEWVQWADVAVSAAGSTAWEFALLGIPAALLVLAENQKGIAAVFAGADAARVLGEIETLAPEKLSAELAGFCADREALARLGARARRLVDGHGARRVLAAMGAKLALTIVSDADSWINAYLEEFNSELAAAGHAVTWHHDPKRPGAGDAAFFLSLSRIVSPALLAGHAHNLVVHESDLPAGRGWSPLTWQILEGKTVIPVCLLEAAAGVDEGEVYARTNLEFAGGELLPELHRAQAGATFALIRGFLSAYRAGRVEGRAQEGAAGYYPRRRPADSRLDPQKTLAEQFNLLRVVDNERYPAFFELHGRRYRLKIEADEIT